MHLDKDRSGYDEIKNEVVKIAKDVLELWKGFSTRLSADSSLKPYADLMDKFRDEAIGEAARVAEQYREHGFQSPFS